MVICRWCKKTIANAGNPQILYSDCSDCKEDKQKRRNNEKI